MPFGLDFNTPNKGLLILLSVGILILILTVSCSNKDTFTSITEHLTNLFDSSSSDIKKLDQNKCSKQCCGQTQWPLPIDLRTKDMTDEEAANYVPTNFSCNLGNGGGCLCVTKNDFNYLAAHGLNTNNM
jgi:hypothetical protein